jgi:membrane fusion protein, macrolide-specific efflux system
MKKWFWILIVVAAAGAAAWWWGPWRKKTEAPTASYETVAATRGDIAVTIESTGVVRPQNRLEIKPPVAGRIEDVLVHEGDDVKAGQIVAWMSSSDRAALLDAARARGPEEVARWQDIYKATPLIAPLDGEIIARSMEPGQTATAADTVLVMSDKLIIEAQVDETDLAQIRLGQAAKVTLDAYAKEGFPARVSHIAFEAETVDNVTIYKVQVLPDQMPEFVRSGMTANVTFTASSAEGKLLVPAEAVRDEGGKQTVSLPSPGGGEPVAREVKTGLTDGKNIEILDGLAEGDLVRVPRVSAPKSAADQKSNPFMPFGRPGSRGSGSSARRAP